MADVDHVVAVVDPAGVALKRCTVEHTTAGLRALVRTLQCADVYAVGIERPDGPVIDAPLEAGFTVFVVAPNQLRNLRSRYHSSGDRTTASTPTSWPTRCAPTATASPP